MRNWTTGEFTPDRRPLKLPPVEQVNIRRIAGRKSGFFHRGKPVAVGETITCDFDLAEMLVTTGKAERV